MKRPGSAADPLWYKDAIIYEVHVRGFADANQDGIGDFQGLIQRLDYLRDLGVTCLWLLPFFPSPLRDDGYDIADYTGIHPDYGTLDDFRQFLDAAHERGLQVMIELVINHTSDQHPWFQAARHAAPGSPERDFYVWSDTNRKYEGTRIIFTDTQKSNWTWDTDAGAYYWHRFFSHQPDLNFDNPAVVEEVLKVMRFWLDLGVDALRLDAIPYLLEREGTSCENLPETHALIRRIRSELDAAYEGRMLLAEANQWPSDVRAYFGAGDECHMAFHFPLMPRLFMALRLEDRLPVTDILAQTPAIPDVCQWGLFLRNHDELTLEMVTDDERDYMYLAYSADPRMRVNVGIRRRLAPLLENDRSRIELLTSILFSFPGTPILYYGDEIGMGDNIYLGDRHGVRTPMQWSADRNGGFSRANPARLYSPVVMDPVFGYEAVNVEAQQSSPSSLLSWTRHMIALRKLFQVFGRGRIEFLEPANRKILAYLRRDGQNQVLCVANLSRFAQPVELDLSELAGMTPIEMRGYVSFPRIGRQPYPLTLAPYGFLWFELHADAEAEAAQAPEGATPVLPLPAGAGWSAALAGPRGMLETWALPAFLRAQRWIGPRASHIRTCRVQDAVPLNDDAGIALVAVEFHDSAPATYALPLALVFGTEAERIREVSPGAVLAPVVREPDENGVLCDLMLDDDACRALFELARQGGERKGGAGSVTGVPGALLREAATPLHEWSVSRLVVEPENCSTVAAGGFVAKVYRRLERGVNPDREMIRYLTERRFGGVPPYAGALEYRSGTSAPVTVALIQGQVPSHGDGWTWMLEELARYYERASTIAPEAVPAPPSDPWGDPDQAGLPAALDELLGISDDAAAVLGRRAAELHLALAERSGDQDFDPEPFTAQDRTELAAALRRRATVALDALKSAMALLPDELVSAASRVLEHRSGVAGRMARVADAAPGGVKIRIHGGFSLARVLRTGTDFVILDFAGERGRPLAERRAKHPPLKDVASMLSSFRSAARTAADAYVARRPVDIGRIDPLAQVWARSVSSVFLRSYRRTAAGGSILPGAGDGLAVLLEAYLLDDALRGLQRALDERPAGAGPALRAILSLLEP